MFSACSSTGHRPCAFRSLACVALLCLGAALFAAGETPPPPLLRSVSEFYALPAAEQSQVHRFAWEIEILFIDHEWKLLWYANGDLHSFVTPGPNLAGFHAGQRLLAEGEIVPARGVTLDGARLTLLPGPANRRPLRIAGDLGDTVRYLSQLVSVEALVERQSEPDPTHLQLELIAEGRRLVGRVRMNPSDPVPQLADTWVDLTGVYVTEDGASSGLTPINLWTPKLADVRPLRALAEDPRFQLPETPVERLAELPADRRVRIAGVVLPPDPAHPGVMLRDATGQIVIGTPQTRFNQPGQRVEAVGFPEIKGTTWRLRDALMRPAGEPEARRPGRIGGLSRLRVAEQVLELKPFEAEHGFPVQVAGVVTWFDAAQRRMFFQDASRGIEVRMPATDGPGRIPAAPFGVAITGRSAMGGFTPLIVAAEIKTTVPMLHPDPRRVTLDQMLSGVEQARWIEVVAYLRELTVEGDHTRLSLTTPTGEFTGLVSGPRPPDGIRGAVVRVRGVCDALTNRYRQLTGVQLLIPSAEQIVVEESAPADLFALPDNPLGTLRQFGLLQSLHSRVRTHGTVIFHEPGNFVALQDGADGLLVLSRATEPLQPGDRVEVAGFPGRDGSRLVLRESTYRRVGRGAEPPPEVLETLQPLPEAADGRLVRVTGRLLDVSPRGRRTLLTLQNGDQTFEALGPWAQGAGLPEKSGSVLALTGVLRIKFDEFRRPKDFELLLRSPADLAVVEAPSWWTAERALAVAGILAVLALAVSLWVVSLRRQVAQQTQQIRAQMEKQTLLEAELERASRLQSLGVLAGGIAHDFNNLLTVVMGNLTLALLDDQVEKLAGTELREAERGAVRARDLTQQLLTFAKGGDPVREAVNLGDLVREAAEFALSGSRSRAEVETPPGLWPAHADRSQVARLVHNLVTNATQSMPAGGTVWLELSNALLGADAARPIPEGRYVQLKISDQGRGYTADQLPHVFDPYFGSKSIGGLGLATAYSIAKRHGGHIEVVSQPGEGAEFTLWLPAGESAAPPKVAAPAGTASVRDARVLILDDEESIRTLTVSALRRLGFAPVAVAEGEACIREYRAALDAGRPFAAVVMDLTIPGGMGGREAIVELKKLDPAVRAIVSSGYSQDPVIANFRDYGFSALVRKPYDIRELGETVGRVVNHA